MRRPMVLFFAVAACISSAWAIPGVKTDDKPLGIGIALGEPTGITGKYWISKEQAVQLTLAWAFSENSVKIAGDWVFHFNDIVKIEPSGESRGDSRIGAFVVPLYAGVGGFLGIGPSDSKASTSGLLIGFRIPLGAIWYFKEAPIELALEIAPGMTLFDKTAFSVSGGLAVRYYF